MHPKTDDEKLTINAADVGILHVGDDGATGIVAAVGAIAFERDPSLAKRKEAAMAAEIQTALSEGISLDDSDTLRARMLAASKAVKAGG